MLSLFKPELDEVKDEWARRLINKSLVRTHAVQSNFFNENKINWQELYILCSDRRLESQDIDAPWNIVAFSGDIALIKKYFSENPKQLDAKHVSGRTPLDFAAWGGSIEAVKFFLQNTKNKVEQDKFISALHYAVLSKEAEVIQYIIDQGADPHGMHPHTGGTLIHTAVETENLDMVKMTFRLGIDLLAQNKQGKTARQLAEELDLTLITAYLEAEQEKQQASRCSCLMM